MAEANFWDLFRITVEGRQYPASCSLINGEPVFDARPIPKGSKPNLKLLAEMLRGEAPIPSHIRKWLADTMDEDASSDFQFKKLSKRKRGAKANGPSANWNAAEYVNSLIAQETPRKKAIGMAEQKFGIKRSAIESALRSYNEAKEKEEHDRII